MQAILRSKIKPALIKLPLTIMVGAAANASKGRAGDQTTTDGATALTIMVGAIAHANKVRATAHASKVT